MSADNRHRCLACDSQQVKISRRVVRCQSCETVYWLPAREAAKR